MVCLFGYGSPNPAVAYSIAIDEWKVQGLNVDLDIWSQILTLKMSKFAREGIFYNFLTQLAYFQTFCCTITCLAFIETVCVNYLMKAVTSSSQGQEEPSTKISSLISALKKPSTWDLFSKAAFPAMFVIFAITHFSIILSAKAACDPSNGLRCLY